MSHLDFQSWLGPESVTRFGPLSWLIIHSVPLLDEVYTGGLARALVGAYHTDSHCTQPSHSPGDRGQPIPRIFPLEGPGCVDLEREKP